MSGLLGTLASWIWPDRCGACDLPGEAPFCESCAGTLLPTPPGCPVCGVPADEELLPAQRPRRCVTCRSGPPAFARAAAPFLHGGALAQAIHRLKYEGREELARPLGVLFAACEPPRADVLVPIPLHRRRLRRRGFDQASLLARAAGRQLGLPVAHLLTRTRETRPQVGLERLERHRNLRGAFQARAVPAGLRVCLIDDVLTTGSTAGAAARALLEAGAARVEVLTLARTP